MDKLNRVQQIAVIVVDVALRCGRVLVPRPRLYSRHGQRSWS
jgi:hypothetical protein